ncbi:MAG: hypothetical protein Q7R65_01650 [bacterium]|nr:hypothetical protein [bacterium]
MSPRFESDNERESESRGIEDLFLEEGAVEKIIDPFIKVDDDLEKKLSLSSSVMFLLSRDYDTMLRELRSSDAHAVFVIDAVRAVDQALKQKLISDKAPWFELLEKIMLTFKIFVADTEAVMDIEKGKKEYEEWRKEAEDRILENLLKAKGSRGDGSNTDKS